MRWLPMLLLLAAAAPDNDGMSRDACLKASGMDGAAASAPVHFPDRSALDVLLITGHYPRRVNKGRAGTMLCLYDRKTRLAQTRDADAWSKAPKP
ncbi:MAG TPA: hypothetical protein VGC28_09985 [Sphingomonas sp.]